MTLYELAGEYLAFCEKDDPDSQIIKEDLERNLKKKVEGWGKAYCNLKADYEKQKEAMDALKEKTQLTKKKMDLIQDMILSVMLATGESKIHTSLFDFSVRSSSDILVVDNEKAVPEEFFKPQPPKLDKTALNKWAKKNSEKVRSFGHYEPKNSLIIK